MCKNYRLILSVGTATLLYFSVGTMNGWMSPVLVILEYNNTSVNPIGHKLREDEMSLFSSMHEVGGLFGALLGYLSVDRLGRKKCLCIFSILIVISYLVVAFFNNIHSFYIGRLLGGCGMGIVYTAVPMYIGEISKKSNRGCLLSLMKVSLSLGHLYAISCGYFLDIKYLSLTCLVPLGAFYALAYFFLPESPYFFVRIGDAKNAEKSLVYLRDGDTGAVQDEMLAIEKEVSESFSARKGILHFFKSRDLLHPLLICVGLKFFLQFSGVLIEIMYMQTIFEESGSTLSSGLQAIIETSTEVAVSCVASKLVDFWGRKPLLIVSSAGCAVAHLCLGTFLYLQMHKFNIDSFTWTPLCCVILFSISFSLGLGVLSLAMVGEMFSPDSKAAGSALCTISNSIFGYIVLTAFPIILSDFGMAVVEFLLGGFCILGCFFTFIFVMETRGKTLLEVQQNFHEGGLYFVGFGSTIRPSA